jgi:hypothetical protein
MRCLRLFGVLFLDGCCRAGGDWKAVTIELRRDRDFGFWGGDEKINTLCLVKSRERDCLPNPYLSE